MRLTCKNFKSFEKRDFVLPDTGLVLLDGPSGVGKTTFTKAVQFALFGNVKKPYTYGKKNLSVELSIQNLNISRQKGPDLLKVNNYEDDVAQGVIHKTIGMNEEEFLASSYIQQKMANSLLTLSPKDQLTFIESLAFAGKSPEEFKNKINKYLNEKKKETERLSGKLDVLLEQQNAMGLESLSIESVPVPEVVKVPDDIESLIEKTKKEYDEASSELKKFQDLLNHPDYENMVSLRQAIAINEQSLATTQKQLDDLLRDEGPNLEELKSEVSRLEKLKEQKELLEKYNQSLEEVLSIKAQRETFEKDKQTDLAGIDGFLEQNQGISETLPLLDSWIRWMEDVAELKSLAQEFFASFNRDEKGEELERVVNHLLSSKKQELDDAIHRATQDLVSIPLRIKELTALLEDKINCPECGASLKYDKGVLTHSEGFDPTKTKDELSRLKNSLEMAERDLTLSKGHLKSVDEQIKTLSMIVSKRKDVVAKKPSTSFSKDLDECLKERDRLKSVADKVNELYRERALVAGRMFPLEHRLSDLQSWIASNEKAVELIPKSIPEGLEEQIQAAKDRLGNAMGSEKLISDAKKAIAGFESQVWESKRRLESINLPEKSTVLEQVKVFEEKRDSSYQKLNDLRDLFNRYNQYKSALALYEAQMAKIEEKKKQLDKNLKEIESLNLEIKALESKYASASYIKSISDKAQMAAVTNIINSINTSAKDFLDILFPDNPMNVQITPFKENKDGSVRFKLSTVVSYKGQEGVDFKEDVSGGENDRIVLAYQLALNSLYNSPIIMLDEPFTGLNPELIELAIDALRLISQNKLVIVISHGIAKGLFDEVVQFD